ncbi:MAG: signal peptidase I [Ruminococcaceae bacterium]|nr:signal peptidase I [Oscillospiraceae bacterium]
MNKIKSFVKSLFSKLASSFKSAGDSFKSKTLPQKLLTCAGIFLCVIFSFLLICNMVIIVKGTVAPEKPPSVFGVTPMVVMSGSMSGDAEDHIEVGDLVFIGKADPEKLETGDVIAFMEGRTVVTHRIIRTETVGGETRWFTKGDANNTEDSNYVTRENLVGIYKFRIPGLGDVAMFMQQPIGMLLIIGIPCLAFIIYDILRRQRAANAQAEKTSEMEAEVERLRKLISEQENEAETVEEVEAVEETEAVEAPEAVEEAETVEESETVEETETVEEAETAEETDAVEETETSEETETVEKTETEE